MFLFKRKKKEETPVTVEPTQPKEKEVKWRAIMKVKFVNVHTDKEYSYESTNNYGFTWDYFKLEDGKWVFALKQKTNSKGDAWDAIAHLQDFSLIEIIREEKSEIITEENA